MMRVLVNEAPNSNIIIISNINIGRLRFMKPESADKQTMQHIFGAHDTFFYIHRFIIFNLSKQDDQKR